MVVRRRSLATIIVVLRQMDQFLTALCNYFTDFDSFVVLSFVFGPNSFTLVIIGGVLPVGNVISAFNFNQLHLFLSVSLTQFNTRLNGRKDISNFQRSNLHKHHGTLFFNLRLYNYVQHFY